MRIRKWLTHLFPKRVFFCPKCKNPIEQNTQQCPYCGEKFPLNFAVKCPRKLLQREHEKELSAYVHQKIFPTLSEAHRNYLARYFTVFFNDGFESADFSNWTWTSGNVSVVSSTSYKGTYSAKIDATNASSNFWKRISTSTSTINVRWYIKFESFPTNAYTKIVNVFDTSFAYPSVYVKLTDTNGQKSLTIGYDSNDISSANVTLDLNTWYCLELAVTNGNGNASITLYLDNQQILSNSSQTITHTFAVVLFELTCWGIGTPLVNYIDNVVFADTYIGIEQETSTIFITQTSNVDSVADIGSHSNFANQQADDSTYDTLTEANTVTQGSLTYRTAQNAQGTSLTSPYDVTVNKPTGIVEGDIIFVAVAWYTTSGYTIDGVPSGFTSLGSYTSNSDKYALYYKIAGASEPSSYTFSFSNTVKYKITSFGYSGGSFNPSDPIDVVSNTAYRTSDTTVRAASMTVANANSPLIFIGMQYNTSSQTFTKPSVPTSDWVEDYDSGSTTPDFWFEFCSMIWSGSGATGNMDATSTGSNGTKHAFAVALKPIPPNYRLELEEEFTDIPYSSYTTWTLHVKTGSYSSPAETLNIQIRDGSTWTTLGALTASTDNTFNVTSYIVASTEQIRFIDGTTSDDVTQSTWQIDAVWLEGSNITVSIPVIMHHLKQMGIS